MTRRKAVAIARWTTAVGAFALGALGYVQPLSGASWPTWSSVVLLIAFVGITVGQWTVEAIERRRAADDFYAEELTEVFRPADSETRMRFFVDKSGNKCVGLVLEREPIPKSVHLWEGGYHAPPITLAVEGRVVGFRYSGYSSYEEYSKGGPMYQVRYFPKP